MIPSQLYLSGRLADNPELGQTKKGHLQVKILLATELVRKDGSGLQVENVVIPISLFSREAEAVQSLTQGDFITIGAHLYGTKYEAPDGRVSHGCKVVADQVLGVGKAGAK
jgi:single-stranded DNA-binding protein